MSDNSIFVKVANVKIDGIDSRCEDQEITDFIRCKEIHACMPHILTQDSIRSAIKKNHAEKRRCFVFITTKKEGSAYVPVGGNVSTDVNEFAAAKNDARFVQYFNSYDMEYMIPVYVYVENEKNFFATIVGQPWIDPAEILKRFDKK